jgi:autotransporter-associated beta strand protein
LDGGTFTVGDAGKIYLGYSGDATVTVNDGYFNASAYNPTSYAATINTYCGWDSGSDFVWNQKGGLATFGNVQVSTSVTAPPAVGPTATFNFDGGVFETTSIRTGSGNDKGANGYLTINFNGGTMKARSSTTYFIYRRDMPADHCQVNVKPLGATIDGGGAPGRYALGAEIREAVTSVGSGGNINIIDTSSQPNTVAGTGVISLSGNNEGFVGNITITKGTLAGGGNIGGNGVGLPSDPGYAPIIPTGINAFGLGSASRTITVETGGTLAFRYSGMYVKNSVGTTVDDYCASAIPGIVVNGGTLAVQPIIGELDENPVFSYGYYEERATVNNVTLNNGTMTSTTGTAIGTNPGIYAWNLNGNLTSTGNSTINCTAGTTPVTAGQPARSVIDAMVALQSGDMANPKTTFDVQDGVLTVSSTLTDGLNSSAHGTAPGAIRATGLTKTGSGTMTIAGNLTYTGNTDIQDGIFQIAATAPITLTTVTGDGTLEVCSGATLTATSIQVGTLSIGGSATAGAASAVPEPSAIVLLLLAGVAGIAVKFRRK